MCTIVVVVVVVVVVAVILFLRINVPVTSHINSTVITLTSPGATPVAVESSI